MLINTHLPVSSSITHRCTSTHNATASMLCGGWMKTLKFDPIELLRLLDPINDESVCETAMRAVIGAATNDDNLAAGLSHLSSPEVRAYRESVFDTIKVERDDDSEADGRDESLDPATAFYLRIVCEYTKDSTTMSASEKNEVLSNLLPDVPVLCSVVQKHLGRLVGSIRTQSANDDDDDDDDEDNMESEEAAQFEEEQTFICLQLLQLVKCADLQEEGSRRHLVSILYTILASQETPDDLVETCIRTMALAHDTENQFLQTISEVVAEINDGSSAGGETAFSEDEASTENQHESLCQIRILSILSVVLEQVSGNTSSMGLLDTFSDSIVTAVTTNNNLVREAGVSCLGKYALLLPETKIVTDFKPLLLQVASNKNEKVEVRAQALLALCDLALLFDGVLGPISSSTANEEEEANDVSFVFLLSEMLCNSNPALVVLAAEVAAKLLFAGKLNDHPTMVAHLVAIFFDTNLLKSDADEDFDEVKEIGNPVRLQQILSLFFPAFSIKSREGRATLANCIKPLLSIVSEKLSKKKRGKKATAWPIAKMVEYVCSNIDLGEEEAKKMEGARHSHDGEKEEEDNSPCKPSSTLLASIAIAEFLTESSVGCTTTYLRAICKIVGGADIILEEEPFENLSILKKSMDEAAMVVTDSTSIRSLETLVELLDEIPDEEEEEEEDEEDDNEASVEADELAEELQKTNLSGIDPAGENSNGDDEENATDIMEEGKPSNNTSIGTGHRQLGVLN